jgi:hypothetical protein
MESLKAQIDFLEALSNKVDTQLLIDESASISLSISELDLLQDVIKSLRSIDTPFKDTANKLDSKKLPAGFLDNPYTLTPRDMAGLPEDLIAQLSDLDQTEIEILELIDMAGGTLVLDKIIAGLFHLTGKSYQRQQMTAKLYRMSKKGLIYSVPKKKGLYTTEKDEEL